LNDHLKAATAFNNYTETDSNVLVHETCFFLPKKCFIRNCLMVCDLVNETEFNFADFLPGVKKEANGKLFKLSIQTF